MPPKVYLGVILRCGQRSAASSVALTESHSVLTANIIDPDVGFYNYGPLLGPVPVPHPTSARQTAQRRMFALALFSAAGQWGPQLHIVFLLTVGTGHRSLYSGNEAHRHAMRMYVLR